MKSIVIDEGVELLFVDEEFDGIQRIQPCCNSEIDFFGHQNSN